MPDYYSSIEGLLEYIKELHEMYPNKSLTELISMVADIRVEFISNKDLVDSIKEHLLQNM